MGNNQNLNSKFTQLIDCYSRKIIIIIIQKLARQSAIAAVGAQVLLINDDQSSPLSTLWFQLQKTLIVVANVFLIT